MNDGTMDDGRWYDEWTVNKMGWDIWGQRNIFATVRL